jgi:small subunit ribosomal protein S6
LRNYEVVVIVDPRLEDPAIQQAVERFTKVIEGSGELGKVDQWGRRRLAYHIDHLSEGFYVVAGFKSEAALVTELDRMLQLGEEYVRHKIVRTP